MRLARTISILTVLLFGAAMVGSALAQQRGSGGGGGYRGQGGQGAPGGYGGHSGYRGSGAYGGHSGYRGHGAYGAYGGYRGHGWYGGHGHSHWNYGVGVYFGAPAFWSYPAPYYYPPYYAPYSYPPAYWGPPAPTEYVERDSAPAAPQRAESYWYFCPESNAYYPYVRQCPGGWQRVAPIPPPESGVTER